ncbi:MAG: phosphate regulon transcriptional regulator PhoB [Pseudomonadota bacterium]
MTKPARILVVDDEPAIREMISFTLIGAGFECDEAADTDEAAQRIAAYAPDLILLDWMLPGRSGLEFAQSLRRDVTTNDIPIIMLSARTEESHKVLGLNSGADDYVTKPFSPRELIARILAVMRRSSPPTANVLEIDKLTLDPDSHRVNAGDDSLSLGPTEFRFLHFFMGHPERVYSRAQLIDLIWGKDVYVEERTVDVHIRRLRKALEPYHYDQLIQTVRSAGYRFSTRKK